MNNHRIRPLYRELAAAIEARRSCLKPPINQFGLDIHDHTIGVCRDLLPSGSGWDCGTKLDYDICHANKSVLYGSFHHMNESGMYDSWTEHTIVVTPSLTSDFDLRISGRNQNNIKDYLRMEFEYALRQDIAYWLYLERFPQFKVSHKWIDQCTQEFSVFDPSFNTPMSRTFKSLADAQSFAAYLMEQAFYAPKENS